MYLPFFFFCCMLIQQNLLCEQEVYDRRIVVFVHGSTMIEVNVLCGLHLMARDSYTGNTFVERVSRKVRADTSLWRNDFMLDLGLVPIESEKLTYPMEHAERHCAAYHIVAAMATLQQSMQEANAIPTSYYTFGWSGLLSMSERQRAAAFLCSELMRIMQEYPTERCCIELHGHSHGGQVILQIPVQQPTSFLPIETVFLWGTPLYAHNRSACVDGYFPAIMNVYSVGDGIQTLDFISAHDRPVYRTLQQVVGTETANVAGKLIDVMCQLEGESHVVGHNSFFALQRYPDHVPRHVRKLLAAVGSLPLVVFHDMFRRLVYSVMPGYHHRRVSFEMDDDTVCMKLQCVNCERTTKLPVAHESVVRAVAQRVHSTYREAPFLSEFRKSMRHCAIACHVAYQRICDLFKR